MAEDNEFLSRKERNERIKNIEYQIEDEQAISTERQYKEKARREKIRKREAKKEEAIAEKLEKQQAVAEAEQAKKKKQQDGARSIMEQKRQIKKQNEKSKNKKVVNKEAKVTKDTTNVQIDPSAITVSASNLAKDNVSTELYVDGKEVSEKVLPEDLVKQIRREQRKAIDQTEKEIKEYEEAEKNSKLSNMNRPTQGESSSFSGVGTDNNSRYRPTFSSSHSQNAGSSKKENFVNNLNHGGMSGLSVKNTGPMSVATGRYHASTNRGRENNNDDSSNAQNSSSDSNLNNQYNDNLNNVNFADNLRRN